MSISYSEESLFREWEKHRPGFVADGVIDEACYLRSKYKIVFVLKEVNDEKDGGGWDLREFLREKGGRAQTWNNIARWIEGVNNLPANLLWADLLDTKIDDNRRADALKQVAVINIKKSPGGATADSKLISNIAEQDSNYLYKQFSLYSPDIVICCGTGDLFYRYISPGGEPEWLSTSRGVNYAKLVNGMIIVAYSHPAARCSASILHYGLVDAIREIIG